MRASCCKYGDKLLEINELNYNDYFMVSTVKASVLVTKGVNKSAEKH